MKKMLLMLSLLACLSAAVQAAQCSGGTLAEYTVSGFTCTLNDLTFHDFSYVSSAFDGAVAPGTSGVAVNPEIIGGNGGFLFSSGWMAGPGQVDDSLITYTATCKGCLIHNLILIMAGGASNTGLASVSETSTSVTPNVNLITGGTQLTDMTTFTTSVGSITLTKDIGVSGGTDGFATISAVSNLFSTVTTLTPEPSLILLCLALLGMIPVTRWKSRKL
jgi:hypothetical protein